MRPLKEVFDLISAQCWVVNENDIEYVSCPSSSRGSKRAFEEDIFTFGWKMKLYAL